MNKRLIIDLDNTLFPCTRYYVDPVLNLMEYIVNKRNDSNKNKCLHQIQILKNEVDKQGNNVKHVDEMLEHSDSEIILKQIAKEQVKIDVKLVDEFKKQKQGFCAARFPYSFLFTFKEFCQKSSFSDRMKAYDIGQEFMNIKPGLYEGVEETLDFLVQQKDSLVLLTKGDYNLQNKKIQINKLNRWFKEICIVNDKLPETFKELAEGYKPKDIYSIGDTIDSEINPALKAGFKAIHIPQQIWRYDEGAEIIDPEKTLIFKSFKDIKTNYYLL